MYTYLHICLYMCIYTYMNVHDNLSVFKCPQICCHSSHQWVSLCPFLLNVGKLVSHVSPGEYGRNDYLISEARSEKAMEFSPWFIRILPQKPELACKKFTYSGDSRWFQSLWSGHPYPSNLASWVPRHHGAESVCAIWCLSGLLTHRTCKQKKWWFYATILGWFVIQQ